MCLLTTTGPHESEPSTKDILKVRGADLVLANGLGLDEQLISQLLGSASKKVKVFEVGEVLEAKHHDLLEHGDEDHEAADKHGHKHGDHDPHIWLGPERAKVMVDIIAEKFAEMDPPRKDRYLKRAADYKAELDKLKQYGLDKFKDKKNVKIVTQHDSLGYFAKEFKLEIVGHIRMQSGLDEGAKDRLVRACKEKRPAAFTFEPQFKKAEVESMRATLKKEGIETELAEVDPLETADTVEGSPNPDPRFYMRQMYKNIDNLAEALK
jgi:zinc transport system substrate-binding protein